MIMKKTPTKLAAKLILLIPALLVLMACAGNSAEAEKTEGANGNDGTWVITKAEGIMAEMNKGTEYIFEGENLVLSGGGIKNKGTYSMSGDTLVFKMKTFEGEMRYIKEMKGKQMVLKVVGSDQVFYLDKK
jgi:hypothetical protein